MISPLGKLRVALVFLFVVLAVNFLAAQSVRDDAPGVLHPAPDGKGGSDARQLHAARPGGAKRTTNGIVYHGGAVLKSAVVPIYIIWYGNWNGGARPSDSQTTVNLIDALLGATGGIGSSP